MKATIKIEKEVEIKWVCVEASFRYVGDDDDDDVKSDFPLLEGSAWKAKIDVDSGVIDGWPKGRVESLHTKVCDAGVYTLISDSDDILAVKDGHVPSIIPNEYGDYIVMDIDENGKIEQWNSNPSVSDFFEYED